MGADLVSQLRESIRGENTYKNSQIFLVGDHAIAKGNYARQEYKWGTLLHNEGV